MHFIWESVYLLQMFQGDCIANEHSWKPRAWELYVFTRKLRKAVAYRHPPEKVKNCPKTPGVIQLPRHLLPLEAESLVVGRWGNSWKERCCERPIGGEGGRRGQGRRRKCFFVLLNENLRYLFTQRLFWPSYSTAMCTCLRKAYGTLPLSSTSLWKQATPNT